MGEIKRSQKCLKSFQNGNQFETRVSNIETKGSKKHKFATKCCKSAYIGGGTPSAPPPLPSAPPPLPLRSPSAPPPLPLLMETKVSKMT